MYIKHGGGKIKRKLLLSVLFIFGFALVLNVNFSSAATVNQTSTVNSVPTTNTGNIIANTSVPTTNTVTTTKAVTNTTVKPTVTNTTVKPTVTNTTVKPTVTTTVKATTVSTASSDGLTLAQVKDGLSRAQKFVLTNGRLPNYVTYGTKQIPIAQFQQILKAEGLSITGNANRPIYITSDNINSSTKDNARINSIISGLKALGLTAYNMGLGPNKHDQVLTSGNLPKNALIVDIYGGADAGLIKEMASSWYKSIKGTRSVFSVFWPPSIDITNLAFLPRAHDDNYDPASFTGIVNPAKYLLNNGYNFIHSSSIESIVNAIFYQANL
jgi:hypothetical protein